MTTTPYEIPVDGRPMERARGVLAAVHVGDTRAGAALAGVLTRRAGAAWPRLTEHGWTPAHSEAARFVGECFAVGALLGLVTEATRPVWEQRHA